MEQDVGLTCEPLAWWLRPLKGYGRVESLKGRKHGRKMQQDPQRTSMSGLAAR